MKYAKGVKTEINGEFEIKPEIEGAILNKEYSNKDSKDYLNIEKMYISNE